MILVTLGTQDKPFTRLLKAIDKEIKNGNIKDKVVVQAGNTKYESSNMEIFDFKSNDELKDLISKSDLIITHGGVATILESIQRDKKVIAVANCCYGTSTLLRIFVMIVSEVMSSASAS